MNYVTADAKTNWAEGFAMVAFYCMIVCFMNIGQQSFLNIVYDRLSARGSTQANHRFTFCFHVRVSRKLYQPLQPGDHMSNNSSLYTHHNLAIPSHTVLFVLYVLSVSNAGTCFFCCNCFVVTLGEGSVPV